ncbi:hypothetical protein ONS96_005602 [Cadophora gregata f. sp. sojae]|nr:hypothetical protein ONS96_005602 [Cadophora gregata f. sp. sojae]
MSTFGCSSEPGSKEFVASKSNGRGQGVPGAPTEPKSMRGAQVMRDPQAQDQRSDVGHFSGGGGQERTPNTGALKAPSPPVSNFTTGSSLGEQSSEGAVTPPDDLNVVALSSAKYIRNWRIPPNPKVNQVSSDKEDRNVYADQTKSRAQIADGWRRPEKENKATPKELKEKEEQVNLPRLPESLDLSFAYKDQPSTGWVLVPTSTPVVPNDTRGHPTRWPGVPAKVPAFGSLRPAEVRGFRERANAQMNGRGMTF